MTPSSSRSSSTASTSRRAGGRDRPSADPRTLDRRPHLAAAGPPGRNRDGADRVGDRPRPVSDRCLLPALPRAGRSLAAINLAADSRVLTGRDFEPKLPQWLGWYDGLRRSKESPSPEARPSTRRSAGGRLLRVPAFWDPVTFEDPVMPEASCRRSERPTPTTRVDPHRIASTRTSVRVRDGTPLRGTRRHRGSLPGCRGCRYLAG